MKQLKFIIVAMVILVAQGVMAVTLPSTSYTPSVESEYYASNNIGGGSLISGHFTAYGAVDPEKCYNDHTTEGVTDLTACENCCDNTFPCTQGDTECASNYSKCMSTCYNGPSLPLDGGLGILLVLPILGGALRRKHTVNHV